MLTGACYLELISRKLSRIGKKLALYYYTLFAQIVTYNHDMECNTNRITEKNI